MSWGGGKEFYSQLRPNYKFINVLLPIRTFSPRTTPVTLRV